MRWVLKDEQQEERGIPGNDNNMNKGMKKDWQVGGMGEWIGRGAEPWETRLQGSPGPCPEGLECQDKELGLHPVG